MNQLLRLVLVIVVGCADDPTKDDTVDDTNSTPALSNGFATDASLSPGTKLQIIIDATDADEDTLATTFDITSSVVAELDCNGEYTTSFDTDLLTIQAPYAHDGVRCPDQLLLRATTTDGKASASASLEFSVAADAGLGTVWVEIPTIPLLIFQPAQSGTA